MGVLPIAAVLNLLNVYRSKRVSLFLQLCKMLLGGICNCLWIVLDEKVVGLVLLGELLWDRNVVGGGDAWV